MKKIIISSLTALLVLLSFAGCAQVKKSDTDTLSVVSTIFAPYDFVKEIAGEHAELTMLVPPGAESHSYEPTPQDIIKIQNSDVFIYVGGESDAWVEEILESMDTSKIKVIALLDIVEAVEEEVVDGMQEEEEEGNEEEVALDEHVWTSPYNAKLIVQKLADTLSEIDPENADEYKVNNSAYLEELDKLDADFKALVDGAKRKTLVFADRFPFRYLADAYGLDYYAAFPGCSTETEASAGTIAFLIDKVNEEKIPVVFHAELANGKIASTLSEETGAEVRLLHAAHNVTKDEMDRGVTYLELMKQNLKNLEEALN